MQEDVPTIAVIGAGLAGSMTACLLARIGYSVRVFEKRDDLRKVDTEESAGLHGLATSAIKRSINLALSHRGMQALQELGVLDEVMKHAIRMPGRVIHSRSGALQFQAYGKKDQAIYSISRGLLNTIMLDQAEDSDNVVLHFNHKFVGCSRDGVCQFQTDSQTFSRTFQLVIGADGAYSGVRDQLLQWGRIDYSREYIRHGYKELNIQPTPSGEYALPLPNGLHIWPRGEFMLIALPNEDKSFTATLFAPFHGPDGFDSVPAGDGASVLKYFERHFPDVIPLMPELVRDYKENPVGSLLTVRLSQWRVGRLVLLGDAAHAVVPFYGQGMNAAFEDALKLYYYINNAKDGDLEAAIEMFAKDRQPAAKALAQLALDNYTDMAAHTTSSVFQFKRRLESLLHAIFPTTWVPLYTMVSFTDTPYHEALQREQRQQRVLSLVAWSMGLSIAASVVFGCRSAFDMYKSK